LRDAHPNTRRARRTAGPVVRHGSALLSVRASGL
jgi:hypothetical protein